MKRAIVVSLLVCVLAVVATAGCLEDDNGDTGGMTETMTFLEFNQDYNSTRDNQTQTMVMYLRSLDEGDTVVIRDKLQNLTYRDQGNESMTLIQFSSYPRQYQAVQGNITDDFQAGDNVTLTSPIINTTFTYPMQGQNWTIHYETFKNGWDTQNNTQTPFPPEAIAHAETADIDDDTDGDGNDTGDDTDDTGDDQDDGALSFYEFQSDYRQTRDNDTDTLMVYLASYDEGDTVTIRDQLQNLSYNSSRDITVLQFSSYTRSALTVEGDITDEYQPGDTVTVTSEVSNVTFTLTMQGTNWNVHYETLTGWDDQRQTQEPFPPEAIAHAD